MKRRVHTQPQNPFYSDEPAVSKGLIADKSMVQNASLGSKKPKMVPKSPGRISGLAGFAQNKKLRQTKFKAPSTSIPPKTKTSVKVSRKQK